MDEAREERLGAGLLLVTAPVAMADGHGGRVAMGEGNGSHGARLAGLVLLLRGGGLVEDCLDDKLGAGRLDWVLGGGGVGGVR